MLATYQSVQAVTADPTRLLLMLLDGGARFLDQARRALAQGDGARFAQAVSRAHAVIGELSATLDRQRGGELADNLGRLYAFMLQHLAEGMVARSAAHVDVVRQLMETIRAGFEGAVAERARGTGRA